MFGLINYEDFPMPFVITRAIRVLKLSIDYSNIRSLKKLFICLHLEYSF